MGSSHYEVTVTDVKGKIIQLTLRAVHPDNLVFPTSKTFALMLVCDPLWHWDDNIRVYGRGMPLFEEMDAFNILDARYVRANAGGFIESVEVESTRNYPMTEETFVEIVEGDEPHHLPEGDYTIKMTHWGWALHLNAGMQWDSASYDLGDELRWEDEKRIPGDMTWIRASNQDEGFFTEEHDEFTPEIPVDYVMPKFGAKHYEPDPALTGQDITPDALQPFLYHPIAFRLRDSIDEINVGLLTEISENYFAVYQRLSPKGTRSKGNVSFEKLVYIGAARYRKRIRVT